MLLPQRPGHGETGGPFLEDQGSCGSADYARSGNATADSIAAAIAYMSAQPFIEPTGIVVVGHSAGGWGALVLASRNPPGISKVVNFAGGRGGRNHGRPLQNCAPDQLIGAAAALGTAARVPTLSLYAENDTYFPPELSHRLATAYQGAGGNMNYYLLPAAGSEGHWLAADRDAWAPYLGAYLVLRQPLRFLGTSGSATPPPAS